MSRKDEMQSSLNSLVGGFIAPQQTTSETPKKEVKKDIKLINKETTPKDNKKTISTDKNGNIRKDKNGNVIYTKGNNYTITFKIDADLDDYLKLIDKITFIESVKSGKIESTTKTEFVNNLIREQYYKLIGASSKDDADTISKKWLDYKSKNNL